jgi:hypothetical protein
MNRQGWRESTSRGRFGPGARSGIDTGELPSKAMHHQKMCFPSDHSNQSKPVPLHPNESIPTGPMRRSSDALALQRILPTQLNRAVWHVAAAGSRRNWEAKDTPRGCRSGGCRSGGCQSAKSSPRHCPIPMRSSPCQEPESGSMLSGYGSRRRVVFIPTRRCTMRGSLARPCFCARPWIGPLSCVPCLSPPLT